jgi:hypothetical protein
MHNGCTYTLTNTHTTGASLTPIRMKMVLDHNGWWCGLYAAMLHYEMDVVMGFARTHCCRSAIRKKSFPSLNYQRSLVSIPDPENRVSYIPELSKPSIFSPSLVLMMVVFDDVAAGPTCQGWPPTVFLLSHITFNNPLSLPPSVAGLRLLSPSASLPDLPPVVRQPLSGSGGMPGGRHGGGHASPAPFPLSPRGGRPGQRLLCTVGGALAMATSKVRPRGRSKVPGGGSGDASFLPLRSAAHAGVRKHRLAAPASFLARAVLSLPHRRRRRTCIPQRRRGEERLSSKTTIKSTEGLKIDGLDSSGT